MIYLKKEINGIEMRIEVYSDEFYSTCPNCGKEHNLDGDMIEMVKDGDFAGTSVYCDECAKTLENSKSIEGSSIDDEKMNYKKVLEEQIRTLQQAQERALKHENYQVAIHISSEIREPVIFLENLM